MADGGRLDHTIGIAHLRLLLDGGDEPVTSRTTDIPVLPEVARALRALGELRDARCPMALVVDEHGGAAGIVRVEDLIEELVGEIYDETDRDVAAVIHEADGRMVLPGRFPIHDLPGVGIELPEGPYATVAGLVLDELGHIPEPGDAVDVAGWRLEVRGMQGRAVTEVVAQPLEPDEPAEPAGAADGDQPTA